MKPRRCARQVYCRSASRSCAINPMILFSNPSRRSLENGRLFGSAQTRSSRAAEGALQAANTARTKNALRQPEDIERASLGGGVLQIGHCIDEAERGGAVARVEIAGDDRAGPAADAT